MNNEGRLEQEIKPCRGGFVVFGSHSGIFWQKNVSCISAFQDALYGPGMRLHNAQGSRGSTSGRKNIGNFRCTVCGQGHGMCRPNP